MVTSITLAGILIYSGVLIFGILYFLKQKNLDINKFKSVHYAFLIYIVAFTFTKLVNSGLDGCFHSFCRTCQDYFVFLWILLFLSNNKKNKKLLIYSILLAGVVSIGYGLMQYFHLDLFDRQKYIHRLSGFHKNPYSYGGQLIVFSFFFLNYFIANFRGRVLVNLVNVLVLIACVFCILNTFERAVILGFLIGLVFFFLAGKLDKKKISSLFLVLGLVVLIINFNRKLFKRIKRTIFPQKGAAPNARLKIWQIAIAIWKRNILFGVDKFPTIIHEQGGGLKLQVLTHAHNVYLQILVVHGLLGLLAFLNLIFSFFKVIFNNLKGQYAICLFAIIVSFLVEGIFEYFWGDSEVRYLLLYFVGFVFGHLKSVNNTVNS